MSKEDVKPTPAKRIKPPSREPPQVTSPPAAPSTPPFKPHGHLAAAFLSDEPGYCSLPKLKLPAKLVAAAVSPPASAIISLDSSRGGLIAVGKKHLVAYVTGTFSPDDAWSFLEMCGAAVALKGHEHRRGLVLLSREAKINKIHAMPFLTANHVVVQRCE
jgi:hypothetical protein